MYGGTQSKRRSQHVQGVKALKATGGNFAFEFPTQKISVEAERPDGAIDVANVSVVAVVPYLIMNRKYSYGLKTGWIIEAMELFGSYSDRIVEYFADALERA